MIILKTEKDLVLMREAGRISAGALKAAEKALKPGITTKRLDDIIREYILSQGAKPSFYRYNGFPGNACISINDEVIHGIPSSKRVIKEGDIVSVDVGAYKNGFHGDNAYTYVVGETTDEIKSLINTTKYSLQKAIETIKPGSRVGDISNTVQKVIEAKGYGIVKEFVGHGIGRDLHEAPEIPNFGKPARGARLLPGMVICIEPMINLVGSNIIKMPDGWTIKTKSQSVSVHFEHTVAVTKSGYEILTI